MCLNWLLMKMPNVMTLQIVKLYFCTVNVTFSEIRSMLLTLRRQNYLSLNKVWDLIVERCWLDRVSNISDLISFICIVSAITQDDLMYGIDVSIVRLRHIETRHD